MQGTTNSIKKLLRTARMWNWYPSNLIVHFPGLISFISHVEVIGVLDLYEGHFPVTFYNPANTRCYCFINFSHFCKWVVILNLILFFISLLMC